MDAYKSVGFGSVVFSLVLGLAAFGNTNASPVPPTSTDGSEIRIKYLRNLNETIIQAINDANNIVSTYCPVQGTCSPQFPSFAPKENETLEEILKDMYKTCVEFQHLLDQFIDDTRLQSGKDNLTSSLESLRDISLRSVKAILMNLKADTETVQPSAQADTTTDNVTFRNIKNVQKVARMATELCKMNQVLAHCLDNATTACATS